MKMCGYEKYNPITKKMNQNMKQIFTCQYAWY